MKSPLDLPKPHAMKHHGAPSSSVTQAPVTQAAPLLTQWSIGVLVFLAALSCGDGRIDVDWCGPGMVLDATTGECVPDGTIDPCKDVACGQNASCVDGECTCAAGFVGDPRSGCDPDPDCAGVECGENAFCSNGSCVCAPGFAGDPVAGCQPADDCVGVTCGDNARCDAGSCVCLPGFTGDPLSGCQPIEACEGVTCGANAYCEGGSCVCSAGFQGDPRLGCHPIDECEGVVCGHNAHCEGGSCVCLPGFAGDPHAGCEAIDPCAGVTCGTNAYCENGACVCSDGYQGDGVSGCVPIPACGPEGCSSGAWCDAGLCRCKWGFSSSADGCVRDQVTTPAQRTREEVCSTWKNTTFSYEAIWELEPEDQCDWGYLHGSYHNAAMGTLNLYRWLVGLEAVASSEQLRVITQACATTLAAEDAGLTHHIPSSYACYTSEAGNGAASSNLAMGTDAIGSVAAYIMDFGVPSLGHRRWLFNPTMLYTAFGYRGRYSCQYAFSYSGSHRPEFVAYPAPGFFPSNAIHGPWSVASSVWGIGPNVSVEIVRLSDGTSIAVEDVRYIAGDTARANSVSFRPSSFPMQGVQKNEEHEVRLKNLTGTESQRSFRLTIVDC